MRAIDFKDIKVNHRILVNFPDPDGYNNFSELLVKDISHERHCIISNMNFGYPIYPNEDDQYIVLNYDEIDNIDYSEKTDDFIDDWIKWAEEDSKKNKTK